MNDRTINENYPSKTSNVKIQKKTSTAILGPQLCLNYALKQLCDGDFSLRGSLCNTVWQILLLAIRYALMLACIE